MENSRKLNLTSHFFLRLPRKAESVYVHVCVCAYHIRILSHTEDQKMLCVWLLADSLTVTFTDWWRQHTITCRMCIQSCVCFWMHVCCYMCVREKGECVVFYSSDLISVSFFYCNADGKIVNVTLCAWCFFLPLFVFLCLCSTQIFSNISSPHKDLWKLLYTSKTNRVYVL